MKTIAEVRPSPFAGHWYEADPLRLAAEVDHYIESAQLPELDGEVVAVIAPHAGHRYSGPVAGYAFAAIRGLSPEIVVVISPMHDPLDVPLLTTAHAAYGTPLGEIPVDQEMLLALDIQLHQELGVGLVRVARDREHSLEIELPFIQRALKAPFKLLPIMVCEQNQPVARGLGRALGKVLTGHQALLVASTDLSHYYSQPVARLLDQEMLDRVEAFDPVGVIEVEEQRKGFACGRGALAAVLWAARELGADRVKILHHATSGDVTGDYSWVVGYGAAVILRAPVG